LKEEKRRIVKNPGEEKGKGRKGERSLGKKP
jgi:hypothetical protein